MKNILGDLPVVRDVETQGRSREGYNGEIPEGMQWGNTRCIFLGIEIRIPKILILYCNFSLN